MKWSPRDVILLILILLIPFIILIIFIQELVFGIVESRTYDHIADIISLIIGLTAGILINHKNGNNQHPQ